MLKGFKDFITRGNLVEMAVAFVMGLAFAAVVQATVALLMDIVGKIFKQPDFSNWVPGGVHVGTWITALIAFLILAAVVYFVIVMPYNALQARMARGEESTPPSPDIALLTEIRDLLAAQRGTGTGGGLG
jgi:large conductance mechanosensitive channel